MSPYHCAKMLEVLKELKVDLSLTKVEVSYKFDNPPYMPLIIEVLKTSKGGTASIIIAHTYIQNGDVMNDPAMTFFYLITNGVEYLIPQTYRNDGIGCFDESQALTAVISRASFAKVWAGNIKALGYKAEQNIWRGGD